VKLSPEYALSFQSPTTDCPMLPHQFHSSADSPNTRHNRFGFGFWVLNTKGLLLKFGVQEVRNFCTWLYTNMLDRRTASENIWMLYVPWKGGKKKTPETKLLSSNQFVESLKSIMKFSDVSHVQKAYTQT
jgi:hypothetical protein